jgi:hypothetical protein
VGRVARVKLGQPLQTGGRYRFNDGLNDAEWCGRSGANAKALSAATPPVDGYVTFAFSTVYLF